MQTAYTDAAGLTLPDYTELGSGNIGGLTLASGLYKWSTGVTIPTDVTLSGGPNEVWIFQIAGDLTIAGAASVLLSGGAQARNIFWQVAGGVGVDLGTTSQFDGTILRKQGSTWRPAHPSTAGCWRRLPLPWTPIPSRFPQSCNPQLRLHHTSRKRHRDPRHHQHAESSPHTANLHESEGLDHSRHTRPQPSALTLASTARHRPPPRAFTGPSILDTH